MYNMHLIYVKAKICCEDFAWQSVICGHYMRMAGCKTDNVL